MAVRVLLVLAALSMLAACGETAQQNNPKPETTQEATSADSIKYGDAVETTAYLRASQNASITRAARS
jgi:multidrug efflux pump subunit AcrA (membrane-fusion protein)